MRIRPVSGKMTFVVTFPYFKLVSNDTKAGYRLINRQNALKTYRRALEYHSGCERPAALTPPLSGGFQLRNKIIFAETVTDFTRDALVNNISQTFA